MAEFVRIIASCLPYVNTGNVSYFGWFPLSANARYNKTYKTKKWAPRAQVEHEPKLKIVLC